MPSILYEFINTQWFLVTLYIIKAPFSGLLPTPQSFDDISNDSHYHLFKYSIILTKYISVFGYYFYYT